MSDYGLAVSWRAPKVGREQPGLDVFVEAHDLYEKAVANSKVESYETVLFQANGGALPGGHTILWGSAEQIDTFARDDEFQRMLMRAALCVEDIALSRCIRGEEIARGMADYGEALAFVG